jgi:PAP2 superfamily
VAAGVRRAATAVGTRTTASSTPRSGCDTRSPTLSRVYTGVHYATDVLAGVALGSAVGIAATHIPVG